jgi:hypothetical protein
MEADGQYQYGFNILAYPFGNHNFYSNTRLLGHSFNGKHHFVFEQDVGFKASKTLWFDLYFTFGPVRNYFQRNGYIIYNTGDLIRLISGAKINWYISQKVSLALDYKMLWRERTYTYYQYNSQVQNIAPVNESYQFFTHLILTSVSWNF